MKYRPAVRLRRTGVAVLVLAVLAVATTSASARNLSVSNQRFRMTWASLEFNPGRVRCPVTLEGSFRASTIAKVTQTIIANVRNVLAKSESCSGGRVEFPGELPDIEYRMFAGTLPTITSFSLNISNWNINLESTFFGFTCLAVTERLFNPTAVRINVASALMTSTRMHEELGIPFITPACRTFGEATVAGEGRIFVQGTVSSIGVRLI